MSNTKLDRNEIAVVVADSLAMPRESDVEVITYSDTWPAILSSKQDRQVINYSERARDSFSLIDAQLNYELKLARADLVILQVGIVDCMPRLFTKANKKILSCLPYRVSQLIIKYRSKRRAKILSRQRSPRTYVSRKEFSENLNRFRRGIEENTKILFIPIVTNSEKMDLKSPGHRDLVKDYNQIARDISGIVYLEKIEEQSLVCPADFFHEDGYHLSRFGNKEIALAIDRYINSDS
jgi:acyl-CoA thioesterase I